MGRATQGVRLIKLNEDDAISSVEKIQNMDTVEIPNEESPSDNINNETNGENLSQQPEPEN
jgi:DNA gyrase subunit A